MALFWRCPKCNLFQMKNESTHKAAQKGADLVGHVNCLSCGARYTAFDVYGGKYDVSEEEDAEEIKMWQKAKKIWDSAQPNIEGTVKRHCTYSQRPVELAVVNGLPYLCLDVVPFLEESRLCGSNCDRHILFLSDSNELSIASGGDGSLGLDRYVNRTVAHLTILSDTHFEFEDYAPSGGEKLLTSAPTFGSGDEYLISGLRGHTYLIPDEDIIDSKFADVQDVLEKCVEHSIRDSTLHSIRVEVKGKYAYDEKGLWMIPEVLTWIQKLHESTPLLWFHADPDSLFWVYACLTECKRNDGIVPIDCHDIASLSSKCYRLIAAELTDLGCNPDNIESLIHQSSLVKNLLLEKGVSSVLIENNLDASINALGDNAKRVKVSVQQLKQLFLKFIKDKILLGYNDGQIHSARFGPYDGLVFEIFGVPCSTAQAQEYFVETYGSYAKSVHKVHDVDSALETVTQIGSRCDQICHIMVCSPRGYEYEVHISLFHADSLDPILVAEAFDMNT